MGWSDTWLPHARVALLSIRAAQQSTFGGGLDLPLLSPADCHSLAAQVTRPLANVLSRREWGGSAAAISELWVDPDDGHSFGVAAVGGSYTASAYLAMGQSWALPEDPRTYREAWYRRPTSGTATPGDSWTIYGPNAHSDSAGLHSRRSAIAAWQEMVDAIASACTTVADMSTPLSLECIEAVWHPISRLCDYLDVLSEIPPPPPTGEALAEWANDAAAALGQLAADAANKAGEIGGQLAGGFLGGIGPLAAGVGVLVVYLALR